MNISKARQLKVGDIVYCPADRGDPSYNGRVTHIGSQGANKNVYGNEYIWVTVKWTDKNRNTVWPSNRLG